MGMGGGELIEISEMAAITILEAKTSRSGTRFYIVELIIMSLSS